MKQIEVEFRALITKEKHDSLLSFLHKNGQDLGEDNKDVHFFLYPNKLLKVVNNISKNNAKLVLKLNKIGNGSDFQEIEIPFNPTDVDKAIQMFKVIGSEEIQNSYQERHNFMYKGVEFAVKYTKTWGFHVELEILIRDQNELKEAEEKIYSLADELELKIMSDKELQEFTQKIDNDYKKGKYKNLDN
jgi:adenylate cyclase class IV